MKCISIRQPYAWLIANGYKDIENRTWPTNYRGPVLIHAAKQFDPAAREIVVALIRERVPIPSLDRLALGRIIGRAVITDCVTASDSDWFEGPFGFVLREAVAFPGPGILQSGKLGLFDVAESLIPPAYGRLRPVRGLMDNLITR